MGWETGPRNKFQQEMVAADPASHRLFFTFNLRIRSQVVNAGIGVTTSTSNA